MSLTAEPLDLHALFDSPERELFGGGFEHDTLDLDFQHGFAAGERHAMLWGFGLRTIRDEFRESVIYEVDPDSDSYDLFSAFFQDDFRISNRVEVTLGAKVEHNDFSGFEFLPNVRGLWKPGERHTIWASIANAVRTPFRAQPAVTIDVIPIPPTPANPVPGVVRVVPVKDLPAEELIAYEVGYRVLASDALSLDFATFYNDYDDLHLNSVGLPFPEADPPPPHLVFPTAWAPVGTGHTFGAEVEAGWQAAERWRLQLAMSALQLEIDDSDPATGRTLSDVNDGSPSWQVSLRSQCDVTEAVEIDVWVRHVEDLPADGVDAYTEMDVRIGWRLNDRVELMLGGRNLLDDRHAEFVQEDFVTGEIERSLYGRAIFRF